MNGAASRSADIDPGHGEAVAPCSGSRRSTSASARAYAAHMTEPAPRPTEPPTPSAEQLAEWRALVERIRQGDRSEVVPWDEVAAELGL
jgi:hypothetical protein